MHHTPLLSTIVVGIVLAFAFGAIAHRLKASPLVGYLLAGVVIGPFTPGFVADQTIANELSEIGVILLMFGVGLQFSLEELLSVRAIAVPGALVQIVVASALGAGLAHLLGWSLGAGLIFGLALSVASTVVVLRSLQERRLLDTERGRIAVGWLVVEDLAMVLVLVFVPALGGPEPGPSRPESLGRRAAARDHPRQVCRIPRPDVGGRAPRHSLAPALRGAHRFARAVSACRARDRARRRLRGGDSLRGLVRPRRVLRRHDPERIHAQPARRAGDAAAARRLRGAVLRLGRDAVQSRRYHEPPVCLARHDPDRDRREVRRCLRDDAALPLSGIDRPDDRGEPRPGGRVLLHPGRARCRAQPFAARRARSRPCRCSHFDPAHTLPVRRSGLDPRPPGAAEGRRLQRRLRSHSPPRYPHESRCRSRN